MKKPKYCYKQIDEEGEGSERKRRMKKDKVIEVIEEVIEENIEKGTERDLGGVQVRKRY